MRTLRFMDEGEDVRLLHAVLNFHLPPPSDQLPTSGDGALNYGPRTVEKVKQFQKLNRIDFGQPDHMDGIVGPHTRAVLESGAEVVFRAGFDPTEAPKPFPPFLTPVPFQPLPVPVPFPPLPKLGAPVLMPPTPQPPFIPVPKLHLDNVQIAAGLGHTINFTRKPTDSTFMQVQYTMLWKSDGPHTEISVGGAHLFSVNSREEENDVQLFGQVTRAQIPVFDTLSVSFFAQIAIQNLQMTNPFRPVFGIGAGAQFQWDIIKDRFAIAAQGMPFFNIITEDDHLKVLTGAQGQGFLILQFDSGER